MSRQGKGKANKVSGIPLSSSFTQIEESSAEPNRKEELNAFKEDKRYEPYARDYFRDEEERLDKLGNSISADGNEKWSEGLNDEANIDQSNPGINDEDEELQSEILEDLGSAIRIDDINDEAMPESECVSLEEEKGFSDAGSYRRKSQNEDRQENKYTDGK